MDIVTYALCKKHISDTIAGLGPLQGKSAYEIAVDNGFSGTEEEWVSSLQGKSPYIGENGNWWVGDTDTGTMAACETTSGIAIEKIESLF